MADKTLTIWGHLEELRTRILVSVIAILAVTMVAMFFSSNILSVILEPSKGLHLNGFSIMDGFLIRWKIAIYTGVAIAFPIWAYQIYQFISPGLLEHEKNAVLPMLMGSLVLFLTGVAFGYYLLAEMIHVLIAFFPSQVNYLPNADDYISFVLFMLLACGLAFQLPTFILILVRLHILSTSVLKKQRKIAYFILFVFAEVITPVSDPIVAPMAVMLPLLILYEGSVILASRIEKKRLAASAITQ